MAVTSVLHLYLNPSSIAYQKWIEASIQVAITRAHGQTSWSRHVCAWAQKYSRVQSIPTNPYGGWTTAYISDEDLAAEINWHLQEIGNTISAVDIVYFVNQTEVCEKYGIKKPVSMWTAQQWLQKMGY
jgi:hypothetical protein